MTEYIREFLQKFESKSKMEFNLFRKKPKISFDFDFERISFDFDFERRDVPDYMDFYSVDIFADKKKIGYATLFTDADFEDYIYLEYIERDKNYKGNKIFEKFFDAARNYFKDQYMGMVLKPKTPALQNMYKSLGFIPFKGKLLEKDF